jgi:hypothetical protein
MFARMLDIGSQPDRITVTSDGDRKRLVFKASTGEQIGVDLSPAQVAALLSGLGATDRETA